MKEKLRTNWIPGNGILMMLILILLASLASSGSTQKSGIEIPEEQLLRFAFVRYKPDAMIASSGPSLGLISNNNVVPQRVDVRGKVTDASGEALIGVSVRVKESKVGVSTDANGNFVVDAPVNAILVFTYIGFSTQEVSVNGRTSINVTMVDDSQALSEVVVVGYGTQKKINLTGAVSSVTSEVLEDRPLTTLGQGLQGMVSNLNIDQGSGELGAGTEFNVRGTTSINGGSPLVLVNGIPMDPNLISPNDVESVTVLKDAASASIYGARAAYGVILITTKGGKKSKPQVSFSSNMALNSPLVRLETMNSLEYATFMNAAAQRQSGSNYFNAPRMEAIIAHFNDPSKPAGYNDPTSTSGNWLGTSNTDWGKELMRESYPLTQSTVSVRGGGDNFNYYTSLNYLYSEGIAKAYPEKFNRYNFMTNLTYDVSKWLNIGTKISINNSNKNYSPQTNNDLYNENNTIFTGTLLPTVPVYWPDGNYAAQSTAMPNAVQMGKEGGYRTRDINDSWLTGLVKITPIKGMTVNFDYSYNMKTIEELDYLKRVKFYQVAGWTGSYQTSTTPNSVKRIDRDNRYHTINAYADYEKTLNKKHYIKALVGYNQESSRVRATNAERMELMFETLPYMSLATGNVQVIDSESEFALRGAFYRLNYSFNEKYLLELNGRYDGSSKFPKVDRFAFFPTASLGWRIDNEEFFSGLKKTFDLFKIRASYGTLGNQAVPGNYPYIATFSSGQVQYLLNGALPMGLTAPGLVSPTLTWESVTQQNFGLDFGAFKNKLSGSLDIYQRDTKNMLTRSKTLPATLGVTEPLENAADLRTSGFDLNIDWKHKVGNFRYGLGLLLSDYKAVITKFDNPSGLISNYREGQNIGEIWGLTTAGLFQTDAEAEALDQSQLNGRIRKAGDIKFADLDGDGIITRGNQTLDSHGDMSIIGNNTPRYSFGIKPNVSWKGFNLDIFLQGVAKRDRIIDSQYFLAHYTGEWATIPKIATDYWTPDNTDAYFPSPIYTAGQEILFPQTRYMQNAAYIRLKQLTLGYTIPKNVIQKLRMQTARVYISGNNLWTGTKMIGINDPEMAGSRYYPLNRTFSFGFNVGL